MPRLTNTLGLLRQSLTDRLDSLVGRKQELVPPRRLRRLTGARGEYGAVGEELARLVIEHAKLSPDERVLDVGCGSGRLAVPLTRHLSQEGRYDGIDVMAAAIRWCQSEINSRFGNFRFHHADLANAAYNPRGSRTAQEFVFPFDDDSFDAVVLTSVFTHMPGPEIDHYIEEVARVLRPGGRLLATCFLLNEESERLISEGRTLRGFPHDFGSYRVENLETPEEAVALREEFLRDWCSKSGLTIQEPILYGKWCGRSNHTSFQDLVVAVKQSTTAPRALPTA